MKIGVVGCAGRMGQMLSRYVLDTDGCELIGGSEKTDTAIGKDIGDIIQCKPLGVKVSSTEELFEKADAVIDFTTPEATVSNAVLAVKTGTSLIIGTTGFSKEQQEIIENAAKKTVIVQAPNMSIGVNLLFTLVEKIARTLDDSYDIEILEMHHSNKIDAPSGTALGLGKAAAKGRGVELDDVAEKVRDGIIGARAKGEIGFATLRGGDVVGEHSVIFASNGERIEISHKASSRKIFVKGAIKAALWAKNKPLGLYSMQDVLELS